MIERVRKEKEGGRILPSPKTNCTFIPSGSKLLDLSLGGGWAEGKFANIIGNYSTGKTLLCIEAAANFARKYQKGIIRYRESEAAFDTSYAESIGLPIKQVDFGKAPIATIEDFYNDLSKVIENALKDGRPELYICDSLDALSSASELENEFGQASYGTSKAKDLSMMFRKLPLADMEKSKVTAIIVSQVRDKIGVTFGRKWTRSGGNALWFYASQVLFLAQVGKEEKTINKIKHIIGTKVKARCEKNKISAPFREVDFSILFGYGIDDINSCLDYLEKCGVDTYLTKHDLSDIEERLGKYSKHIDWIYRAVEQTWQDTEDKLAPKFKKYEE
jgi:recombination protein RecA